MRRIQHLLHTHQLVPGIEIHVIDLLTGGCWL
jgi:hypothetical protein